MDKNNGNWTPSAGDRVSAGKGEDYDTGTVFANANTPAPSGMVWVAWDTLVETITPIEDLQRLG
jgi:hypothetical protein